MDKLSDALSSLNTAEILLIGLLALVMLDLGTYLIEGRWYLPFRWGALLVCVALGTVLVKDGGTISWQDPILSNIVIMTITIVLCSCARALADLKALANQAYEATYLEPDHD